MMRNRKCYYKRKCLGITLFIGVCFIIIANIYHEELYKLGKEYRRNMDTESDVESWLKQTYSRCNGNFIAYGHQFAELKYVTILAPDQKFHIPCESDNSSPYVFDFGKEGTHLNRWMKNVLPLKKEEIPNLKVSLHKHVMVAVQRYEYANLYHTMTDWYNVFLVSQLLDIDVDSVGILLFDNSTKGHMDETWITLFGDVFKVPTLKNIITVERLIWNILGYESPINYHGLRQLPYVEPFRSFFLRKHGVSKTKQLDCNNLRIFFIWRRNYVAHPNNPSGKISRRVMNENELIESVKKKFPTAKVHGHNLENLTFHEQVAVIANTDILISMHGAGLSHILSLPSHAAVFEMFPTYWLKFPKFAHFEAMARWRGVKYLSWQNLNPTNDDAKQGISYVPPSILLQHVIALYEKICIPVES